MAELRASTHLSLPVVLRRLRLEDDDVVAVFLVGSRLWGSATFESDYDFIVVHRSDPRKSKLAPHTTLHSGEIDASVLHVDEFRRRVEEDHEFYELLCLWLPAEYRWKDRPLEANRARQRPPPAVKGKKKSSATKPVSSSSSVTVSTGASFVESLRSSFRLQPARLFASIDEETTRDWRMAQKYLEKGNLDRTRKTVVHALRLLLLAGELARDGRMSRFHAAQCYSRDMSSVAASSEANDDREWSHYERRYRPEFDRLRAELLALCSGTASRAPTGP